MVPELKERFLGCLYGLAAGDALGYAVEFCHYGQILRIHGPAGRTDFAQDSKPYLFSDDTQMSISTAQGLLDSENDPEQDPVKLIYKRYLEWLDLQSQQGMSRAPGVTCMSALRSGKMGSVLHPINESKGCGGVMRVAPIGLLLKNPLDAFELGRSAAAITHGHPSGYLSAGFLASLVSRLCKGEDLLTALQKNDILLMAYDFAEETRYACLQAYNLAERSKDPDIDNIEKMGEGWVGEEALAIALYSVLRYPTDFKKAVACAVNHSGDSDSTGSIAGAISGALLGANAIPLHWRKNVEDSEKLAGLADSLYNLYLRRTSTHGNV